MACSCSRSHRFGGVVGGTGGTPVSTLYEIRSCRRLKHPFPFTRLVKLSDGKPISGDYGYSYSIVRAIDDVT